MNNKWFQYLALFLLLVVLPAGSWYYLQKGLDYRLETKRELKDFGAFLFRDTPDIDGTLITQDSLKGKLAVVNIFRPGADVDVLFREVKKVHKQFDTQPVVQFLFYATPADSLALRELADRRQLYDPGQIRYLVVPTEEQFPDLHLPAVENASGNPVLALADMNGKIRQFYDFRDGARVKRLVEHLAILLPIPETDKPELVREKEK